MRTGVALVTLLVATAARAAVSEPEGRAPDAFDFMNLLADHGLHPLDDERWNAYGQLTWISSFKPSFNSPYRGQDSLSPNFEHSFTGTFTAYLGAKLWHGAELYWVPEVVTERPLSHLVGLGGVIQNFELQKGGGASPTVYSSRLFLKQTINLGGEWLAKDSDPQQLATNYQARRLTVIVGNFSVLDFFDKNNFAGDLRRQFFNMAFLTYAAYDFAADARGYTWGALAQLDFDAWVVRIGRAIPPVHPNQLELDFRFWEHYGDQLEVEHSHTLFGHEGAVRILGFRNQERMARFDDAVAAFQNDPTKTAANCTDFSYGNPSTTAPDLCWARKTNVKVGIGINIEQEIVDDVGFFARAMYADGKSEVYSFTSNDRSLSFGLMGRGNLWGRHKDFAGIGFGIGWISAEHARYLNLGGVDGFIGDGKIHRAPESVLEAFYAYKLPKIVWLSLDYQFISNPAYNSDRGPVHIFGVRVHAEF
jgi:hypothetical protein